MQLVAQHSFDRPSSRQRLALPFLTTSFAWDLQAYLALWPLWWLLGVEQLLLPLFISWEFARQLLGARGRFSLSAPLVWAFLLALWWLVPALWVRREDLDIFLKEAATIWSQALLLFLFWNGVRSERDWERVMRGLSLLALYIVLGGLIFIFGIWTGKLTSGVGGALPQLGQSSSAFFASIVERGFGKLDLETPGLAQRVSSFALHFSSLSMVCLLLIPLQLWRQEQSSGARQLARRLLVLGLIVVLIYTQSRIAYLAFLISLLVYGALRLGLLNRQNRLIFLGVAFLISLPVVGLAVTLYNELNQVVNSAFVDYRSGSWITRRRIYEETLRLLPEHLWAGWGLTVRIEGQASIFSAGSHSSYLGMLFQHGVVGLALYLGLWASLWRRLRRMARAGGAGPARRCWMALAAGLLAFNIREATDSWWWDQLLTITIWSIWGLLLAASRWEDAQQAGEAGLAGPQRDRPGLSRDGRIGREGETGLAFAEQGRPSASGAGKIDWDGEQRLTIAEQGRPRPGHQARG